MIGKAVVVGHGQPGVNLMNLGAGDIPGNAQATAQYLGDEQLGFKHPLFHGHDLKHIVHVPAFGQLVDGKNKLYRAASFFGVNLFNMVQLILVL